MDTHRVPKCRSPNAFIRLANNLCVWAILRRKKCIAVMDLDLKLFPFSAMFFLILTQAWISGRLIEWHVGRVASKTLWLWLCEKNLWLATADCSWCWWYSATLTRGFIQSFKGQHQHMASYGPNALWYISPFHTQVLQRPSLRHCVNTSCTLLDQELLGSNGTMLLCTWYSLSGLVWLWPLSITTTWLVFELPLLRVWSKRNTS